MSLEIVILFYQYKLEDDNLTLVYWNMLGHDNLMLLIKNHMHVVIILIDSINPALLLIHLCNYRIEKMAY